MKSKAAVFIATVMASKHELLLLSLFLLGSALRCQGQNEEVTSAVKHVFLSKSLNATESERILKSARESFLLLKGVEKLLGNSQKLNFAKNYVNFLSQLFKQLKAKDVDVRELFLKENSFLKDYKDNLTVENVNVKEVQSAIENFQMAAERLLVPHYNSSSELYDVAEILNLENSRFEEFLEGKLRTDYCEIGYFFLEVFATLIGLSWGIISTIMHLAESMGGN